MQTQSQKTPQRWRETGSSELTTSPIALWGPDAAEAVLPAALMPKYRLHLSWKRLHWDTAPAAYIPAAWCNALLPCPAGCRDVGTEYPQTGAPLGCAKGWGGQADSTALPSSPQSQASPGGCSEPPELLLAQRAARDGCQACPRRVPAKQPATGTGLRPGSHCQGLSLRASPHSSSRGMRWVHGGSSCIS